MGVLISALPRYFCLPVFLSALPASSISSVCLFLRLLWVHYNCGGCGVSVSIFWVSFHLLSRSNFGFLSSLHLPSSISASPSTLSFPPISVTPSYLSLCYSEPICPCLFLPSLSSSMLALSPTLSLSVGVFMSSIFLGLSLSAPVPIWSLRVSFPSGLSHCPSLSLSSPPSVSFCGPITHSLLFLP